jgi:uncharacterized membrane protein YhaH (DUF805 family)
LTDPGNQFETMSRRVRGPFTAPKASRSLLGQNKRERPMLGFVFGFNARIGRLHYLLCSLVVGAMATAGTYVVSKYMIQQLMTAEHPSAATLVTWPLYAVIGIALVVSFMVQSMRIRDMGWNPIWVMPAWTALYIADKVVAAKFPAWAIGHNQYGTAVGGVINLAVFALLVLMPSVEPRESMPMDYRPFPDLPPREEPPRHEPPRQQSPASPPASPPRTAAPTRPEFGRRQAGRVA